jgi:chromosome segregation ATPase
MCEALTLLLVRCRTQWQLQSEKTNNAQLEAQLKKLRTSNVVSSAKLANAGELGPQLQAANAKVDDLSAELRRAMVDKDAAAGCAGQLEERCRQLEETVAVTEQAKSEAIEKWTQASVDATDATQARNQAEAQMLNSQLQADQAEARVTEVTATADDLRKENSYLNQMLLHKTGLK